MGIRFNPLWRSEYVSLHFLGLLEVFLKVLRRDEVEPRHLAGPSVDGAQRLETGNLAPLVLAVGLSEGLLKLFVR